jgi:hypothetical protein
MLKADNLHLPESIDGWKLTGPPQKITRETIFDYMDGGGELYLAYKFNQLLVWHYQPQKESEEEIIVEVYEMQHPDETFGLLSLDWTGEPVRLNEKISPSAENPISPSYTALMVKVCFVPAWISLPPHPCPQRDAEIKTSS